MTGTFSIRCRRCGTVLQTAGPRITEEALRAMREHVRQVHPHLALPADAGAILAHFDVEQAP